MAVDFSPSNDKLGDCLVTRPCYETAREALVKTITREFPSPVSAPYKAEFIIMQAPSTFLHARLMLLVVEKSIARLALRLC
jgi:hypothetical protein